jgi:hypothetical protein
MGRKKNERSFQQEVFDMIERETGNTNIIAVHQEILRFAGDLETGIFLSQLIYWCDKGAREDGFLFKALGDWQAETGLSVYAVRRATKKLKRMGLLKTKIKKANGFPTVHYHLKQDALIDAFLRKRKNGFCENTKTIDFAKTKKHKHKLPETTKTDINNVNNGNKTSFVSSFFTYKKKFLLEKEVIEGVEYYLRAYKKHTGEDHPHYSVSQWKRVCDEFLECYDSKTGRWFDLGGSCLFAVIDNHFEADYDGRTDYRLLHFISGDIRANRFYETEKCF